MNRIEDSPIAGGVPSPVAPPRSEGFLARITECFCSCFKPADLDQQLDRLFKSKNISMKTVTNNEQKITIIFDPNTRATDPNDGRKLIILDSEHVIEKSFIEKVENAAGPNYKAIIPE